MTEIVGDGSSTEATKLVNLVDLANSLTYRHEISSLIQRGMLWHHFRDILFISREKNRSEDLQRFLKNLCLLVETTPGFF